MSAIKKFFEKRKLNAKFKELGGGHQLNAPPTQAVPPQRQVSKERQATSSSSAHAGSAAIARFEAQKSQSAKMPTSAATTWKSSGAVSGNAPSEAELTYNMKPKSALVEKVPIDDVVLFCCPMCPVTLPRKEVFDHLYQCFLQEISMEPLMISITMIHTLNRDKQKVEACINILCKYLQNIIDHPTEEKYLKIRKTNKIFQEKVACLLGVQEFLEAGCGFESKNLPFDIAGETSEHPFFVMRETLAQNTEQVLAAKQMLMEAEPLDVVIDRNAKFFKPSAGATHFDVPQSFYEISTDDVKQKQGEMSTEVEKSKQLRTKAMREADSGPKRIYKYCIIRVRFPDGILLQGTFLATDKLAEVRQFVQEHLALDWIPFTLADSIGRPYLDETSSLAKLKLTPGTLMNFSVEANIVEEVAATSPTGEIQYLNDHSLALLQMLM